MSTKDIFAERFTLLRNVYHFTYKDLGNFLGCNANTLTEWAVSRRNSPNLDKLVLIANLYGVSLDWLLGRSSVVYNRDLLSVIEQKDTISMLKQIYHVIPNDYADADHRLSNYSAGIRANIITLTYSSLYSALRFVLGDNFYKREDFKTQFDVNRSSIIFAQTKFLSDQGLVYKMLHKELTIPPFDVEQEFKNSNMRGCNKTKF